MAITFDSLSTVKRTVLGFFQAKLSGWGLGPKDFFGKLAAVQTLVHYQFLATARKIDRDAVPTSETSTAGLDEWAENGTGVPNGSGGYGRKGAQAATGGAGTATGVNGSTIPDATGLTASDGGTKFKTVGLKTVSGGTASLVIVATTAGAAGNLDSGAVLTFDSAPAGLDSSVTLTTGLSGGLDQEANPVLLGRVQGRIRNPGKAFTDADLRDTAEGVGGCARAYVYPRRNGTGSADVVPTIAPSATGLLSGGRDPGDPTVSTSVAGLVDAAIKAARNVALEGYRTIRPTFGAGMAIVVRPTPASSAYAFDWTEPGALTVAAYSAGTPSLTLSGAAADLGAKVIAGLKPRLAIKTTGLVLPQQVRVTAYNAGTFVCTLEAALATAPTVGDAVYAGGPMVDTIAEDILALVNELGPSRAAGYLPDTSVDTWDDTLRIDQLRRVVLDALDGETRMAVALAAAPTINGSSADVQAADTLLLGPALPFASSIVVKQ